MNPIISNKARSRIRIINYYTQSDPRVFLLFVCWSCVFTESFVIPLKVSLDLKADISFENSFTPESRSWN